MRARLVWLGAPTRDDPLDCFAHGGTYDRVLDLCVSPIATDDDPCRIGQRILFDPRKPGGFRCGCRSGEIQAADGRCQTDLRGLAGPVSVPVLPFVIAGAIGLYITWSVLT